MSVAISSIGMAMHPSLGILFVILLFAQSGCAVGDLQGEPAAERRPNVCLLEESTRWSKHIDARFAALAERLSVNAPDVDVVTYVYSKSPLVVIAAKHDVLVRRTSIGITMQTAQWIVARNAEDTTNFRALVTPHLLTARPRLDIGHPRQFG